VARRRGEGGHGPAEDDGAGPAAWTWTGGGVDGTLSRDGSSVALEADVQASAQFARWLRSIVPSTQALVFYDEGYSADVALTPDTTEEQLTRPFLVN